jgi:putative DNA primase/helicase
MIPRPLPEDDYRALTAREAGQAPPDPVSEEEAGPGLEKWEPPPDAEAPGAEAADLTYTDTGNAARLVARHGPRLRHIARWSQWVVWSETQGRWCRDYGDVEVRELAKDVGRDLKEAATQEPNGDLAKKLFASALKALGTHGISGMVDLARGIAGIPLDHEALDRDGWLLGVAPNGVIDLRTGQVRAADPTDLMTMQCPTPWDPEARAPRWERAMEEWFPDEAVRAYVQRLAGAALVGAQPDHVFVIHYGGGRNGKGTFVRVLQRVLGPYAVVIHLSLLVEQKHPQHDTVKAQLFRARLAVASETQRRVKLDEASVKNLTGGDRITARRMREDPWEFDPSHSLWLLTNHLPAITGRDLGIWSRVRVIKWVTTFADSQQDRTLDATLAGEAPGILRWLVEGCLDWQRDGLAEPETVVRDTLAYRAAEDRITRFAADVELVFQKGVETPAAELLTAFDEWSEQQGITPTNETRGELNTWLTEQGARQTRGRQTGPDGKLRRGRVWVGVGLGNGSGEP